MFLSFLTNIGWDKVDDIDFSWQNDNNKNRCLQSDTTVIYKYAWQHKRPQNATPQKKIIHQQHTHNVDVMPLFILISTIIHKNMIFNNLIVIKIIPKIYREVDNPGVLRSVYCKFQLNWLILHPHVHGHLWKQKISVWLWQRLRWM